MVSRRPLPACHRSQDLATDITQLILFFSIFSAELADAIAIELVISWRFRAPLSVRRRTNMSTQLPIDPIEGQASSTAYPPSQSGFSWNGPAGFWIAVVLMIAVFTALGLYLA